jgi:hypothetical protein
MTSIVLGSEGLEGRGDAGSRFIEKIAVVVRAKQLRVSVWVNLL